VELDTIVCGDCLDVMAEMPDGCVDLIVTSPPYWNQREYSYWPTYDDYMIDVDKWIGQCARILKSGRHCFWVIPDKIPFPPSENGTQERLYYPIYVQTESSARRNGLIPEFPIIWLKYQAAQRMFGSYPYPPTIIHTPMTERICVWRKPGKADLSRKNGHNKISLDDWKEIAKDIWQFRSPDHKIHPGEYPEELPKRSIICWSFIDDLIFDPFIGSGTTAVAALKLGRHFYGCDISPEYVKLANERIEKTRLEMSQMELNL